MERFAGRYVLLRCLGRGGMGEVYLARDLANGQECALKRLLDRAALAAPDLIRHEFEALTRLRHPAVVAVQEFGFAPDGTPYYTMEYVPGVPSHLALPRGDWAALCVVAAEVAAALEALHAGGVAHGDLKPSNLLVLSNDGGPPGIRLLDFGLAALLDRDRPGRRGTPGYAAPEVVEGGEPGVAADLYGFGSTLYTLGAGRPAFEGDRHSTVLRRQRTGPPSPLPLEEAGTPPALVQLVLRLMAQGPAERPRDAREVRRELERIHPAARRPLAARLETGMLVGRGRELARLDAHWLDPPSPARVVVVTGEPGSGKSALLGALATRASLAGRAVARLSCSTLEGAGAGARALLRRLAAEAGAGTGSDAGLPPAGRALLQDAGAVPRASDFDVLAGTAAGWLAAIAKRSGAPLVLIDDGERLDPLSREFIRRLVLHPSAPPALWLWARAGAPGDDPVDERMLRDAGLAETLVLGRLDAAAVGQLAATRLHEPAPAELTQFLWEQAGGHPGYTVELLRAVAREGVLAEEDAGISFRRAALEGTRMPESFEASLAARVASLPPGPRAAAAALAVWGRAASAAELAAIAPAAQDQALATLERAGAVRRDGDGRFTLSPPALAGPLLRALDDDARATLHRAALEREGLAPAERFRHLRGAGDTPGALDAAEAAFAKGPDERLAAAAAAIALDAAPTRAAAWYERLARHLSESGRHAEAIAPLERALELDPQGEPRFQRWTLLSTAHLRAGSPGDVARVVARALAADPPDAERAELISNDAAGLQARGKPSAARARAEEALRHAEASGADEPLGVAALTLAGSLLVLGDLDQADAVLRRAEQAFARAAHATGRIRALGARAHLAQTRQAFDEAARLYETAVTAARREGLRLVLAETLINRSAHLVECGRWSQAHEALAEAARLAMEDARPRGVAIAVTNLAQLEGLGGRGSGALRQARGALRLTREFLPRAEASAWRAMAQAWRVAGRPARAMRSARRALILARGSGAQPELDWCLIEYGRACVARGRWREAHEVWQAALADPRPAGSVGHAILLSLAGRAALRHEDLATAQARLATADAWLEGHRAPYAAALAEQLRAELALVQRRTDEGAKAARRSLEMFAALPAPADRAAAIVDFASLLPEAPDAGPAPVIEWLEEAAGAFGRMGDRSSRARALALQVQRLRRAAARPAAAAGDRDLIERVSWLLYSLSDLGELAQRAMQMAVQQLRAERGVLLLAESGTGEMVPIADFGAVDAGTRREAVGYSRQVVRRVAESGGSLLIGDAPADPNARSESVVNLHLRSILCVPLYVGERVVGAVYLDDSRRPEAFGAEDREIMEGFARLMAVAIENSRGHQEVRQENQQLVDENLALRQEVGTRFTTHNVIGASSQMRRILAKVERAAQVGTTVLLTGESGTGKETLARTLHHSGKRHLGPFVAINCGALPEGLLESELFGILPNVATGVGARPGRFVQADGGTLFLDEIGAMPMSQQVALLSVMTNREVTPVGGGKPIPVDVRIIAATNSDLRQLVEEQRFREDLLYRLSVIEIEIPPLRERKADIPMLARHFLAEFARQQERPVPEMSPRFLAALMQSDWPGNVRELQNYIERVIAMTPGPVLEPQPLPRDLEQRGEPLSLKRGGRLADLVAELERRMLRDALERTQGNQSLAARELGLTEQSVRYRLRKYKLIRTRGNRRIR